MNAERRKELNKAIGMLEETKAIIEQAQGEESDFFDNMPESLQSGDKGQKAEEVASSLGDIADNLDTAISDLQNCIDE